MSDAKRAAAMHALRAAGVIEKWSLPNVDGPIVGRVREERKSQTAQAAQLAYDESMARGYQDGLARAQAQMQPQIDALNERIRQMDSVLQLMGRPLQQLDAEIEKELLQLALAVGKQLARRELRIDPAQVIAIIRETLGQLPAAARDVRVHLHPEDAATVRERLPTSSNERAWAIVEDPTLSRGGCIVRTDNSQIDVRLESRINAVIANALGEERAPEREASSQAQDET